MTNENVFDALEICFQAMDQGADVESCLARYPELADELRPALMAAEKVRTIPNVTVPAFVARRGRARVLQAAAEMREQDRSVLPAVPFWRKRGFLGTRISRMAITTAIMSLFLLTGGTGLVSASNNALPGDHLYPVKRSWEGVQLFFVFDKNKKVELEHQFDHEREDEIKGLYSVKRIATVNFQGIVQSQQNPIWVIDNLSVEVEHETIITGEILVGSIVQVLGATDDGIVKASQLILIEPPVIITGLPTVEPTPGFENTPIGKKSPEGLETPGSVDATEDGSDQTNENAAGSISPTKKESDSDKSDSEPAATRTHDDYHSGSMENGDWRYTDSEHEHDQRTPTPKPTDD